VENILEKTSKYAKTAGFIALVAGIAALSYPTWYYGLLDPQARNLSNETKLDIQAKRDLIIPLAFAGCFLILLASLAERLNSKTHLGDLPIKKVLPNQIKLSASFIKAIKEAKTQTDILESITFDSFIRPDDKSLNNEPIVLINSHGVYDWTLAIFRPELIGKK
jgi:hypothetical protein